MEPEPKRQKELEKLYASDAIPKFAAQIDRINQEYAEHQAASAPAMAPMRVDPREIELREGVRVAERSGMKEQARLYRDKLIEYLNGQEPGLYVKREAELLGEEFFKTFPVLDVISWCFESPEIQTTAKLGRQNADPEWAQRVHDQQSEVVKKDANTETHYGFKIELAPGVYIYYPYIAESKERVQRAYTEDHGTDYSGRMIPVAGLELVTKARESGWFSSIQVLDPLDVTKHAAAIDERRQQELEAYKEMLEKDPLVVGIGLDDLPRQIYHWIGTDEQAMTKEQIAEQIKGLEGWLSTTTRTSS